MSKNNPEKKVRIGKIIDKYGRSRVYWKRLCEEGYLEHFADPGTGEVMISFNEVNRYEKENTVPAE